LEDIDQVVLINICTNANHHVSDNDLNHQGGYQRDFDKSEPLLMGSPWTTPACIALRRQPNSCAGEIPA
jgi:hypothetical protein